MTEECIEWDEFKKRARGWHRDIKNVPSTYWTLSIELLEDIKKDDYPAAFTISSELHRYVRYIASIQEAFVVPALHAMRGLSDRDGKATVGSINNLPARIKEVFAQGEEYVPVFLKTVKEAGAQDAGLARAVCDKAPGIIAEAPAGTRIDRDYLLLQLIHDTKSAGAVGRVIDRQQSRDGYARKVRRLY